MASGALLGWWMRDGDSQHAPAAGEAHQPEQNQPTMGAAGPGSTRPPAPTIVSPRPLPLSSPPGFYPPANSTGITGVDAVVDAVLRTDVGALAARASYRDIPCVIIVGNRHDVPYCDGLSEGTPVPVLPGSGCGGAGVFSEERLPRILSAFFGIQHFLVAVWAVDPAIPPPFFADDPLVVQFGDPTRPGDFDYIHLSSSGHIVRLSSTCNEPDPSSVRGRVPLLPPLPAPAEDTD
ncbi:MAG: hypothetical protein ACR2HN_05125 [Tepidiformaceae bacterium]